MLRLIAFTCCMALASCVSTGNAGEPIIKYAGATLVQKKMIELFPDFKNANEVRKLIEITLSSNVELIKYSMEKSTTLFARVSDCDNKHHIATVAFNSVFYHGKDLGFYLFNESPPESENSGLHEYQVYLNYNNYLEEINNKGVDICIGVFGNSYGYKFESNRIQLPTLVN